jgi:hypothetical protein
VFGKGATGTNWMGAEKQRQNRRGFREHEHENRSFGPFALYGTVAAVATCQPVPSPNGTHCEKSNQAGTQKGPLLKIKRDHSVNGGWKGASTPPVPRAL